MAEIGTVGPSRRSVTPGMSTANPEAFGAGVSRALGGLAETYAQSALVGQSRSEANSTLELAHKERQDRVTKSRLNVEFITLQNELKRDLTTRYDESPLGAPGFTDQTDELVGKRLTEFQSKIPAYMLPDFADNIEVFRQDMANTSFQLQTGAENYEFKRNALNWEIQAVNDIMGAVVDDVEGFDVLEEHLLKQLDDMFKATPLGTVEARNERVRITQTISKAKLARLVQGEALGQFSAGGEVPGAVKTSGNRVYSESVVAAGLPSYAVGLLNAIAGPESGGDYNVMYSPEGRRYFSDFSDHPNKPATITEGPNKGETSSAAGKYQFLVGTWRDMQGALGLADFSPENQDIAAWHLAQQDYKAATGRDLVQALQSGSPEAIIGAKRVLEGTWEGLKESKGGPSDAEFVQQVLNGQSTPSSLLFDEEFSSIPYDDRLAIVLDGQAKANAIQVQMNAQRDAEHKAGLDALKQQFMNGQGSLADMNAFDQRSPMTFDEKVAVEKVYAEYNEQQYQTGKFFGKMSDPNYIVDSEEDKKQMGIALETLGLNQAVQDQDNNFVAATLLPILDKGYIPPSVVSTFNTAKSSSNLQQATFAMDTMNQMRARNGSEFERAFGAEANQQVALWNAAKGSVPQNELINFIRNSADPNMKASNDLRRTEITKFMKENPNEFTPPRLAAEMGFDGSMSTIAGAGLYSEFAPVFEYMYTALGDVDTAKEAALSIVKQRYGEFTVNGEMQTMRYPPNMTAPAFNGGYEYLDLQLRNSFNLTDADRVSLVSDTQTEAEYLNGEAASYILMRVDDNNLPVGEFKMKDRADYDPREDGHLAEQTVRWFPEITKEMKSQQVELNILKDKKQQMDREFYTTFGAPTEEQVAAHEALTNEITNKDAELKYSSSSKAVPPVSLGRVISGLGPMYGEELGKVITELKGFSDTTPTGIRTRLKKLDAQLENYYPVFQRWEVRARINELLKELE